MIICLLNEGFALNILPSTNRFRSVASHATNRGSNPLGSTMRGHIKVRRAYGEYVGEGICLQERVVTSWPTSVALTKMQMSYNG